MSSSLTAPAPAKLNLCLNITGRRADGYHELQTVFQLLDYGDELRFSESDNLQLSPEIEGLATEDNLIYRAAKLLQAHVGTDRGAAIELHKRLPMGGGIGGGSSNAATTLLALNKLWDCGLSLDTLAELGQQLGADVPVFVRGQSAWAEGVGEQLTALELPARHYVVLVPPCHVSTAEIFSRQELTRNNAAITIAAFFRGGAPNVCQPVVRKLYPDVDKALIWLEKFAPSQLTGTGCCVFASFAERQQAEQVLDQIPAWLTGFVASGVNRSPTHEALAY